MYKMELKRNEKILLITISRLMTEEESISYIAELEKNIKNINPAEYSFVADLRELNASPQNLIGLMQKSIELITSVPFKKRYSIMPKSVIASSQLKRVGKQNDKFIFVESYEDILELIA